VPGNRHGQATPVGSKAKQEGRSQDREVTRFLPQGQPPGRLLEAGGDAGPRQMTAHDRIRLIDRRKLTTTSGPAQGRLSYLQEPDYKVSRSAETFVVFASPVFAKPVLCGKIGACLETDFLLLAKDQE